ncbi:hypothetical protein [Blastopirellula marina]|uniref:Uncharacterized protein n=1 Tax=Blastopirellula marina TaxID=124 RepID=A0A2S8GQP9_9BACT|nr:hypothetical protein [Blastopirellula marina]PQO46755.1 hypothetical protein C5Y93_07950 [Blastopirellula marina]
MNDAGHLLDTARPIPGELSCLGIETSGFEFSFDDVMQAIHALDGDETSGLAMRHGTPLTDAEMAAVGLAPQDPRPQQMSACTFCVGGGAEGRYVCFIYGSTGPLWLRSRSGDANQLFEIAYDSGCDTELGVFTGELIATCDEIVIAARHFFLTQDPSPELIWIPDAELGFCPWQRP